MRTHAAVVLGLFLAGTAWAVQPTPFTGFLHKCAASKIKAAGSKAEDKIKCHATSFGKGQAIDPSCLTKANNKFANAFLKAEAKGGCSTTGDTATIEGIVDGLVDGVVSQLVPANPT